MTTTTPLGTTSYAYAATGALRSITDATGGTLTYGSDGQLPNMVVWGGAPGRVRGWVARGYDAAFRVASLTVDGALVASYQGAILYSEEMLARDAVGRITQRRELLDGITTLYGYQYDAAGRLAAVTVDGAQTVVYAYDANGNRTARTTSGGGASDSCQYDDQDRLLACGGTRYAHNAVGQLTEKTLLETGATTRYDYDVFGNLRAVTLPDTRRIDYDIDGQNRRIGKSINGVRSWGLLYQTQLAPIAELDGDNRVVSTFVYGTRKHVPDYMVKGGVTYRFVVDHLGSVRMVVNVADGSVAQRLDYDEYGRVLGDTNAGFQPFGFAGGIYDADTGLVRFGARDYDAVTGRWTAKDPILFEGGQENLYVYVNGDPVNRIDPEGKQPEPASPSLPRSNAGCVGCVACQVGVLPLRAACFLLPGSQRGPCLVGLQFLCLLPCAMCNPTFPPDKPKDPDACGGSHGAGGDGAGGSSGGAGGTGG